MPDDRFLITKFSGSEEAMVCTSDDTAEGHPSAPLTSKIPLTVEVSLKQTTGVTFQVRSWIR